jgi:hypothetical protein
MIIPKVYVAKPKPLWAFVYVFKLIGRSLHHNVQSCSSVLEIQRWSKLVHCHPTAMPVRYSAKLAANWSGKHLTSVVNNSCGTKTASIQRKLSSSSLPSKPVPGVWNPQTRYPEVPKVCDHNHTLLRWLDAKYRSHSPMLQIDEAPQHYQ